MRAAASIGAGMNLGAFIWLVILEAAGRHEPTDATLGPLCLGMAVVLAFVASHS